MSSSANASVTNEGLVEVLTGSDDGSFEFDTLEYSVTVAVTGNIACDWSYTNLLGGYGLYDYAGFLVDGNFRCW